MVESRWWQDGPMARQPPHLHVITGEGWLVVASPAAQFILQEAFSRLVNIAAVKRHIGREGQDTAAQAHRFSSTPWPSEVL